jgi:uncharacterized protein (TIGR02284 family)
MKNDEVNNKVIDVLNEVLEINNDRIEGYETAYNETEEVDLKTLFTRFQETSRKCKAELEKEVERLGGTPRERTNLTGKIHRVWMDFKAMLTGKDRVAILTSCEYGDDSAVKVYETALANNIDSFTKPQHKMLQEQYELVKKEHDKIKELRDVLAAHK